MTRYDRQGNKIHFRQRFFYFTPNDEEALSERLREMFPEIIFCEIEGGKLFSHRSLADCGRYVDVLVPDAGWKPRFGIGSKDTNPLGITRLLNPPRFGFRVHRSLIETVNLAQEASPQLHPPDRTLRRCHPDGQIQGYFREGDLERKQFIERIITLASRSTSNSYELVNLKTGEIVETCSGDLHWAGPHAIRLCNEDPDFFCFINYRDSDGLWLGGRAVPRPARRRKG